MTAEVWVSSVMSNSDITNKQGIREKFFGEDWAPPKFEYGAPTEQLLRAFRRHSEGEKLARTDFPEAMYVFSEKHWRKVGDLFSAGPFYAVKGKLADVLKRFDLGDGELIEFPIYQADKATLVPGPFYLLNFGAQKDSFLPEASQRLRTFFTKERDGQDIWKADIKPSDGDIAVSTAALDGPDLWFEPHLADKIFMSARLHDAIAEAKIKTDFWFSRARIISRDAGLH